MAAKTTKRARELDENRREAARLAFLYDELEHAEVARKFNVATVYIVRLARDEDWDSQAEDLGRDPAYLREREKHAQEQAKDKVRIERLHSKTSVLRARAQHAVARRLAEEAAQAKTVKEVHSVARALGPASQDVTSGRLAVGLSTEKAATEGQAEAFTAEMDRIFGPARKSADNRGPTEAPQPPQEAPPDGTPTG